jgi:outer membrane protein assembly factor BamB
MIQYFISAFPNRFHPTACWLLIAMCPLNLWAGDWPQTLGPNRDGYLPDGQTLPASLPSNATPVWTAECGAGYAGPAIVDDAVILYDRIDNQQRVRSLQLSDGSVIWDQRLPDNYSGGMDSDKGPRCTPTIADGRIYIFSAGGQLSALELSDGSVKWTRDVGKTYSADEGYFGHGSSPIVIGDRVILNIGAKRRAGIIAVSTQDGATLWEATKTDASYASPIELRQTKSPSGAPVVVVPTRLQTFGLDSSTGDILFDFRFGSRGPTVNAATPIELPNGQLFLTASYGIGSYCYQIETAASNVVAKESFAGLELLSSQYASPVYATKHIFGTDGREDMGGGSLRCIDPASQTISWEKPGFGIAHLITDGQRLLAIKRTGGLILFAADSQQFLPLATLAIEAGNYRPLPAMSGTKLILKNANSGRPKVICLTLE